MLSFWVWSEHKGDTFHFLSLRRLNKPSIPSWYKVAAINESCFYDDEIVSRVVEWNYEVGMEKER
jgi:hypothetical protein